MIERKEWTRPASSGQGEIFSRLWAGEKPRAILEIAHGMAEHSGRYDAFAAYMAEQGFAVCMNDHAGHGKSAVVQGHFAEENGWDFVVEDLHALMEEVKGRYPGLPCFLMGHSMGSFLSRSYLVTHGEGLSGCILCGTMGTNPGARWGRLLAALQKKIKGPRSPGKLLDRLATGGYNKRIQNPVNRSAWLSTVDEVCRAYETDPDCGFVFTAAGYEDLFSAVMAVNSREWAGKVPAGVPIYLVAGEEDPVGNYGKGVREVYERLRAAGKTDTRLKLYPGKRHELLNESNREEVYADILNCLNGWLSVKRETK